MAIKSQHLQALFARRRELEHQHIQRNEAVNRYFNHWDRVNSRFENWTTPEYYKQAEKQLQNHKERKEKQEQLTARRQQLSTLLENDKKLYAEELRNLERPKQYRRKNISTTTLERIDQNLKQQDDVRRKLELEAKLYGKWRHGVDDENRLFETAKSDNEVMAKLNWLDKKVEEQLQREKDEIEAQERNIRLQEELNKAEQLQKERQQIREQEIREIRALQEEQMHQVDERQKESELLKEDEKKLNEYLEEIDKELELLNESLFLAHKSIDLSQAYNLKKIKMFIRTLAEGFTDQIKVHMNVAERMRFYATKPQILDEIISKYKSQLNAESQILGQIEAMYESEAKYNLYKCEEAWRQQHKERCDELIDLLNADRKTFKMQLTDNLRRQEELIELRSTYLSAIECASEKLKQITNEQADSPRKPATSNITSSAAAAEAAARVATPSCTGSNLDESNKSHKSSPRIANESTVSASSLPQITKSFSNLNLDVWENLPSSRKGIDALQTNRSLQIVTPETAVRPTFGRKRVAWT